MIATVISRQAFADQTFLYTLADERAVRAIYDSDKGREKYGWPMVDAIDHVIAAPQKQIDAMSKDDIKALRFRQFDHDQEAVKLVGQKIAEQNVIAFMDKDLSALRDITSEFKNNKFSEVFELNKDNKEKKILYMVENSKIMKCMINKIKQIKSISIKSHEKISEISTSGLLKSVKINNNKFKYNLIIICAGNNSSLVKKLFNNQIIENSYRETSITTILKRKNFSRSRRVTTKPRKITGISWPQTNIQIQQCDNYGPFVQTLCP